MDSHYQISSGALKIIIKGGKCLSGKRFFYPLVRFGEIEFQSVPAQSSNYEQRRRAKGEPEKEAALVSFAQFHFFNPIPLQTILNLLFGNSFS